MAVDRSSQVGKRRYLDDPRLSAVEDFHAPAVNEHLSSGSRQAKTTRRLPAARMSVVQLTGRESRTLHGSREL